MRARPSYTGVAIGAKLLPDKIGSSAQRYDKATKFEGEYDEDVDVDTEDEVSQKLLSSSVDPLKANGTYQGLQLALTVLWAFGWGVTLWTVSTIRTDHDQLRTPSHVLNTNVSYRYWTPAWWAKAVVTIARTLILYFSAEALMRTFDSAPRVAVSFWLKVGFVFELVEIAYLLLERYLGGCNWGSSPWLICHDERYCHPNYAARPGSCSNDRPLLIPPLGGLQIRHEWRVMLWFSVIHLLLLVFMTITVRRIGNTKPAPFDEEHAAENYRELAGWHWFLLVVGLGTCAMMYFAVATRLSRMDHLYVRSPSTSNAFLSSRYGVVWLVHGLGVVFLPITLYTGVYMLLSKKWSVMAADTHRFALLGAAIDAIIRLVLCTISLHVCNGAMVFWSNTCHSRRLCCLRFDQWVGNQCAGVGLLYGNTTTPENDIWACDPPLADPQQLDRDSGFTWTFVVTGFSLLFIVGMLWNWAHLRAWRRNLKVVD